MEESIPQKSTTMSKPSSWQNNCKQKHRVGLEIIAKYFSHQSEDFCKIFVPSVYRQVKNHCPDGPRYKQAGRLQKAYLPESKPNTKNNHSNHDGECWHVTGGSWDCSQDQQNHVERMEESIPQNPPPCCPGFVRKHIGPKFLQPNFCCLHIQPLSTTKIDLSQTQYYM